MEDRINFSVHLLPNSNQPPKPAMKCTPKVGHNLWGALFYAQPTKKSSSVWCRIQDQCYIGYVGASSELWGNCPEVLAWTNPFRIPQPCKKSQTLGKDLPWGRSTRHNETTTKPSTRSRERPTSEAWHKHRRGFDRQESASSHGDSVLKKIECLRSATAPTSRKQKPWWTNSLRSFRRMRPHCCIQIKAGNTKWRSISRCSRSTISHKACPEREIVWITA